VQSANHPGEGHILRLLFAAASASAPVGQHVKHGRR